MIPPTPLGFELIHIVVLAGLIGFTILDIKYREMPALFTTGFLFTVLLFYGASGLYLGVLTFVLALLLAQSPYELHGEADIKLLTAFGIMMPSKWILLTFLVIFMFYGIIYKVVAKKVLKMKKEAPFIPVILMTYITYLIVHYGGFF